jgi:hypothetical protein
MLFLCILSKKKGFVFKAVKGEKAFALKVQKKHSGHDLGSELATLQKLRGNPFSVVAVSCFPIPSASLFRQGILSFCIFGEEWSSSDFQPRIFIHYHGTLLQGSGQVQG